MRLTDVFIAYEPQVLARNDTIHVTWENLNFISYMRSVDGGETWDSLMVLTEPDHRSVYADLSMGDNGLLVSWQDDNEITHEETIAIRTSRDGTIWNDPLYIFTDNMHHFGIPASATKGDSIFLAYNAYRPDSTGWFPIRSYYSYDYGITWSEEVTLGHTLLSSAQDLLMNYCNGFLMAIWAGDVDTVSTGYHVIGYRSTDAGQSWSDSIWISPNIPYSAQNPCIACNEETGEIAVGYMDYRYQEYAFHGDIFIAISDDGGLTWPGEVMATENHAAWDPSIGFKADTLVVVWSDRQFYDNGQHEIMFNRSDNGGMIWQGEYRLTNAMGQSLAPWISMDSSKLHVVWNEDEREPNSNREIYYKRYTPDPTTVDDNKRILPAVFSMRAYPNPFNSNLRIFVESQEPGSIVIYNILGRVIAEFEYESGSSLIQWDATGKSGQHVSTGIYIIGKRGGDVTGYKKVLYLK